MAASSRHDGAASRGILMADDQPRKTPRPYRLIAVIALFAAFLVLSKTTHIADKLGVAQLRSYVIGAGPLGVFAYLGAFSLGLLLHVPGMLFVAMGIVAYGKSMGFGVALAGAVLAVSVTFGVVRGVGGSAIADIQRPFIQKMMARLDQRPVATVVALRTVFWIAPPLNYALALSSIRFRDYVIGSFVGLIAPLLAATLLFEWLFA